MRESRRRHCHGISREQTKTRELAKLRVCDGFDEKKQALIEEIGQLGLGPGWRFVLEDLDFSEFIVLKQLVLGIVESE